MLITLLFIFYFSNHFRLKPHHKQPNFIRIFSAPYFFASVFHKITYTIIIGSLLVSIDAKLIQKGFYILLRDGGMSLGKRFRVPECIQF